MGKFVRLVVILIFVLALLLEACEPGGKITFENLSNEDVIIYFSHVRADGSTDEPANQGVVAANTAKILSIVFIDEDWVNRIEAKDPSGRVVFSHDYKMADLEKIGWRIVIPP